MRARFNDCDILDLSKSDPNPFQEALIKNGVLDAGAITDVGDYRQNTRLTEIAANYQYDEDADDIMTNELEFI